jgi:hypothetical protein
VNRRILVPAGLLVLILASGFLTHSFTGVHAIGTLVAAWLTLAIFSFLWKDNPFYRLAEYMMVGLSTGYFMLQYTFQIIEPQWFDRLFLGKLNRGEEIFGSAGVFRYALVIPAIFGILMLTRILPKAGWMSRWSMALLIGVSAGMTIPLTIQANVTTQLLVGSELPARYVEALNGAQGGLYAFAKIPLWQVGVPLLIIGTLCGLIYFFFSIPHRGPIGHAASFGVWILMIAFGTSFGLTVMARLSLFIGRCEFLLKEWLHFIT